jgi:hypothetical protein
VSVGKATDQMNSIEFDISVNGGTKVGHGAAQN